MSREGIGTILGVLLFTAVLIVGAILTPQLHLTILAIIFGALTLLVLYFFRDPERSIPDDANLVLSPADGKVIEIVDENEGEYLQMAAKRVSIFLSVFDVHVNRIPISGTVGHFRYQRGSFVQAYKKEASDVNEQTIIGIETGNRKILFKQIAGILARRIVCDVRQGHAVKSGERFGIIKFGSRVDIFLPKNCEVKVQLNQKVKGGESIIGEFNDENS
jgi:phosphatidylserine decarboxylase